MDKIFAKSSIMGVVVDISFFVFSAWPMLFALIGIIYLLSGVQVIPIWVILGLIGFQFFFWETFVLQSAAYPWWEKLKREIHKGIKTR